MDTLTPWQLGCVNTAPQKALRLPQSLERRMHKPLKLAKILRDAVRNRALKIAPHMFIRVKLWCIAREPECLKAGMLTDKLFGRLTSMRHPGIPEQQDRSAKMPEKMPKKPGNLRRLNVFTAVKSRIEGQAPAPWRNTDGGDGGNLSPTCCATQLWCLPPGRPSANQVWDKEETALVKKYQMGAKSFGLFLYAAIDSVSTWLWPFRPAPARVLPVSGNSSPTRSESSRYWAGCTAPHIWSRSPGECGPASRHPCRNRPLTGFAAGYVPAASFGPATEGPGVLWPVSVLNRLSRVFCSPAASVRLSSMKSVFCPQPGGKAYRRTETPWRAGAVFPTVGLFQVVSCIVL